VRSRAAGTLVLLVEDDAGVRSSLAHLLRLQGLVVQTAPDGAAGLRAASTRQPDLILLDILLPGLDGVAVAQRLKSATTTTPIPIIALTGVLSWLQDHPDTADLFATVLFKPITNDELIRTIEKVLGV